LPRALDTRTTVERARRTHCLSCTVDKRIACRVHSTNALLFDCTRQTQRYLVECTRQTHRYLPECSRQTNWLFECPRQRHCPLAERARLTSSALDRRTALFWSAIESSSVLSSSPLDNRVVTKSTLSCQRSTMLCIPKQRCPHIRVPYNRNMLELPPTPFEHTCHVLGSR